MGAAYTETSDHVYDKYIRKVYTNVIDALTRNQSRKFTVSHVASFARWFEEQSLDRQITVYSLVRSEQISFVGGSWTEADEAVTHYRQVIDDLMIGSEWLRKRFQECANSASRIGWQYYSMSHTSAMASILSQSMYDMVFLFQVDKREREMRRETKELEFVWKTGKSDRGILVTMPHGAELPERFDFDPSWYPISQEELEAGGTNHFVRYIQRISRSYATNHIYLMMGKDFSFRNAEIYFQSIENLMNTVSENTSFPFKIFYSSPQCYMKALYESGHEWPSYEDDFAVNSDNVERYSFQTGFFTSRSSLKHEIRLATGIMETGKVLDALSGHQTKGRMDPAVNHVRFLLSHAIQSKFTAGISSQEVAKEFQGILRTSLVPVLRSITESFTRLEEEATGQSVMTEPSRVTWNFFSWGPVRCINSSSTLKTENNGTQESSSSVSPSFAVGCISLFGDHEKQHLEEEIRIFNPLSHPSVQMIRIPVFVGFSSFDQQAFVVRNWQGYDLQNQLLPIHCDFISDVTFSDPHSSSDSLPSNSVTTTDPSVARHEIVFKAILPAMGFTSFVTRKRLNDERNRNSVSIISARDDASTTATSGATDACISNDFYQIDYDAVTGSLRSIRLFALNQTITFTCKWLEYESGDRSNHYTLDVKQMKSAKDWTTDASKLVRVVRGPLVSEIHCSISPYISHVVRVYSDQPEIEIEWMIKPAPVDADRGKELFLRIQSEPLANNYFMTDSNCKGSVKRSLNTESGRKDESELLASSLYPINCFIAIHDTELGIAVIPDRPQAGTSIRPGRIEMLVHRTTSSIPYGSLVPEPLKESGYLTGKHRIFISTPDHVAQYVQRASADALSAPVILHRTSNPEIPAASVLEFSCLRSENIPPEIAIISLERWDGEDAVLIRLEHRNTYGFAEADSSEARFSFKRSFACFTVCKVVEVTLNANSDYLQAIRRQVKWRAHGLDDSIPNEYTDAGEIENQSSILLRAGEMRTFILWIKYDL